MTKVHRSELRVLLLNDALEVGGVERVVVNVANSLRARGIEVGVLAEPGGEFWRFLNRDVERHVAPKHRSPSEKLAYIRLVRRLVKRDGWTILHVHQRQISILSRIAVLGLGVCVVEHVHNTFSATRASRLASFHGNHLIACGSAVYRMLVRDFRKPSSRIAVVLNGVSDPIPRDADLTLPSTRGQLPKILGVGRLSVQKDPLRFVAIVRAVHALGVPVLSEWVGEGELEEELLSSLRDQPVPGFTYEGASSTVASKFLGADLLLITSRWEGLPLVALEAMAAGRGIVSLDVGSCRDAVDNEVNGRLLPPDASPVAVAKVIVEALTDHKLGPWGSASREKFLVEGHLDRMIDDLLAVYRSQLV